MNTEPRSRIRQICQECKKIVFLFNKLLCLGPQYTNFSLGHPIEFIIIISLTTRPGNLGMPDPYGNPPTNISINIDFNQFPLFLIHFYYLNIFSGTFGDFNKCQQMTKTAEKPTISNNNNNKKQLWTTYNNQQQPVTTKKTKAPQKPPRNTKSHQELSKLQEPSTTKKNHEEPLWTTKNQKNSP